MADSSITGRGLSRRDFLKVSGVTAGALGLACAGGMTTAGSWLSVSYTHLDVYKRQARYRSNRFR